MALKFHETVLGARFFEKHVPQLITALTTIADSLDTAETAMNPDVTHKVLEDLVNVIDDVNDSPLDVRNAVPGIDLVYRKARHVLGKPVATESEEAA
tara:strand:+ start:1499 stop:1789 length:291 start_codon:yes stop_codon:yes gene_type:complete